MPTIPLEAEVVADPFYVMLEAKSFPFCCSWNCFSWAVGFFFLFFCKKKRNSNTHRSVLVKKQRKQRQKKLEKMIQHNIFLSLFRNKREKKKKGILKYKKNHGFTASTHRLLLDEIPFKQQISLLVLCVPLLSLCILP